MLQALFSSKIRIKMLKLFLTHPGEKYYGHEISRRLEEPLTPIRRELLNLKKVGFLKAKKTSNIIYYFLKPDFLLCDELRSIINKAYGIASNRDISYKNVPRKKNSIHDENTA